MNLDDVEFAFTCQKPGLLQKHSFGKGGFDAEESFDTSVECDVCGLPSEVSKSLKESEKKFMSKADKSVAKKKEDMQEDSVEDGTTYVDEETSSTETKKEKPVESKAVSLHRQEPATETYNKVSFGPSNCIETWLVPDKEQSTDGEGGYCYVSTQCENVQTEVFKKYPIGVIASNKDGVPVRHLFGKNSFNAAEEFNTLIRATGCYGLDETAEAVTMENEIKALSKVIYGVKQEVDTLQTQVGTAQSLLLKEHQELSQYHKEQLEDREMVRSATLAKKDEAEIRLASLKEEKQQSENAARNAEIQELEKQNEESSKKNEASVPSMFSDDDESQSESD
jgi:hypothetical protein